MTDAVAVLRTTADVFPRSANACDSLAEALDSAGDVKSALAQYRQAFERLEKYPDVNRSYERNRAATIEKIHKLEERVRQG